MIKHLRNYSFGTVIPFALLHVGCTTAFLVPFRWSWVGLMLAMYVVRMFGITAGYHRYFSHRSYKLSRGWQFLMAFLAETSGQKASFGGQPIIACITGMRTMIQTFTLR